MAPSRPSRIRPPRGIFLCLLAVWILAFAAHAENPASIESDATVVWAGRVRLDDIGGPGRRADARSAALSFLVRRPLASSGWYVGAGGQAERYWFSNGSGWPYQLQDFAGVLALEYFEGGENAATLSLRPGWYYERQPTSAAWDIPVDLVAGLPVSRTVSGVIGFSDARFYHRALPVAGLVWTPGPRMRIEAVYPEPALVFTLDPKTTLRLGGELAGTGFLAHAGGVRTPVEFVSYRVGVAWSHVSAAHCRFSLAAGYEAERSFDFFRQSRRLEGRGAAYLKLSVGFTQ